MPSLKLFSAGPTMDWIRVLRFLLHLGALALFSVQMVQALMKYNSNSTFTSTELVNITDVKMPLVTMCQSNQFNHSAARQMGYQRMIDFVIGNITEKNGEYLQWRGNINTTYNSTIEMLYNVDYESLNYRNILGTEDKFILPNGKCKVIHSIVSQDGFYVEGFEKQTYIFITDPDMATNYTIVKETSHGDPIQWDTNKTRKIYKVTLKETFWLHGAQDCQNYGKDEDFGTYGECLEHVDKLVSLEELGCCVPWMSSANQCQANKSLLFNLKLSKQV